MISDIKLHNVTFLIFAMKNQEPSVVFDKERAASYDRQFAPLAPMRNALHLLSRLILSDLPAEAHILCVGAGTAAELLYFAEHFPGWRFTAVKPAAAMLDVCRQRTQECGIASRCTFHEGYLDSLPASEPFDAATCLLVSHFIMDVEKRTDLFRQIAARLRLEGILINADLTSDMSAPEFGSLLPIWRRGLSECGMSDEVVDGMCAAFGRDVALLSPQKMKQILIDGGFESPVLFLQTLLIHAWFSKRSS